MARSVHAPARRGERTARGSSLSRRRIRVHGTGARNSTFSEPIAQLYIWSDAEPRNSGRGDHRNEIWRPPTGPRRRAGPLQGGCRRALSGSSRLYCARVCDSEQPFAWIDRLATEAINAVNETAVTGALQDEISARDVNRGIASVHFERIGTKRTSGPTRARRGSRRSAKRLQ